MNINIVLTKSLTEMLCTLPALRWASQNTPWVSNFNVVYSEAHEGILKNLLKPYSNITLMDYERAVEELTGSPAFKLDSNHSTYLRKHIIDHAFHTVIDVDVPKIPGVRSPIMFDTDSLPPPLFVGSPFSHCVLVQAASNIKNKFFKPEEFENFLRYLISLNLVPVLIGNSKNPIGEPEGCVDLTNNLTLEQIASLMYDVGRFIGFDGDLVHLAASVPRCKIISVYTSVSPIHSAPDLGPERLRVVTPSDPNFCGHCQTKHHLLIGADFSNDFHPSGHCALNIDKDIIKELDFIL